jgi:hypothetical protein
MMAAIVFGYEQMVNGRNLFRTFNSGAAALHAVATSALAILTIRGLPSRVTGRHSSKGATISFSDHPRTTTPSR